MRANLAGLVAVAFLAAGCGDKAQVSGDKRKVDDKGSAVAATGMATGDWKSGDLTSWEAQLKARAQNQNEYTRAAPAAR